MSATVRSWTSVAIAAVALGLAASILLYFPDRDDGSGAMLGGIGMIPIAALGLAAVTRARPLPTWTASQHVRNVLAALAIGVLLGAANLGANRTLALLDARIYEQALETWSRYSPWSILLADPMLEEIVFRLFVMGGVAWLVSRRTTDRRVIFGAALATSAVLFGLVHIVGRPVMPVEAHIRLIHSIGVVVKSAAAGAALGTIFWRWGMPYSFLSHATGNATHLLLAPLVF